LELKTSTENTVTVKVKCERCGYCEFKQLLQEHHIDEDRNNNEEVNKIILCGNCHQSLHYGLWLLSSIRPGVTRTYSSGDKCREIFEKARRGEIIVEKRGPDKQKRKTDGYKAEQERRRQLKYNKVTL